MEYVEVHSCGYGTQKHQIYMATDETAHPGSVFRMQHCYVHDANGGNNIKSRAERNEIYYNWIEGAQYHELELIGPDGQNPALAREDSDVVGNVFVKTGSWYVTRFGGDGTGATDGRYRFVNNTVIVQPGGHAVFRLFDGIQSVEMHNNAFVPFGSGSVNLVHQSSASWTNGQQIAGSNNWVWSGATNIPSSWTATMQGSDPGFVDLSSLDLHLQANSVLVDAGCSSLSGPPGFPFPSPLNVAQYHPPSQVLEPCWGAEICPQDGAIDVGAYGYDSPSSGTGGSGGSAGANPGVGGSGGSQATGGNGSASGGSGGDGAGPHTEIDRYFPGREGVGGLAEVNELYEVGGTDGAGDGKYDELGSSSNDSTPGAMVEPDTVGCSFRGRLTGRVGLWVLVGVAGLVLLLRRRLRPYPE